MKTLAIPLLAVALSGCAALPSDLLLEQNHTSSATQHMRAQPTNVGYNASMMFLRWRPTKASYVDLGEGVSYSAEVVPHHPETFQGRFGIDICLRNCGE